MPSPLPTALVIGPMRTATTWIHRYLKHRDDVCLPKDVKETFFFDRRFEKGVDWYGRHFQNCQGEHVRSIVEVGPSYFHSPAAPERIRNALGQIPLIVIYRDPLERSFSHFAHLRRYGFTNLPLRKAVQEFPEILEASRYAEQLERWVACFGAEALSVLRLDTLRASPDQFATHLTEALDLSYQPVPEALTEPVNQSAMPDSSVLAGMAWRAADVLRGWRLHKIVEWAKQMGVKDLLLQSTEGKSPEMSDSERTWLRQRLEDDIQRTPQMLSRIERS